MIKYFLKLMVVSAVVVIILSAYAYYRLEPTYKDPYAATSLNLNGIEVLFAMHKSEQTVPVKKLLIGDSVCEQIYSSSEYNDSIYSLSCNQAISLAGHYALLEKFFSVNKDALPETVILYYNPFSLHWNLDKYAFHYFLKTLYYNDSYNESLREPVLNHRVHEIPYYWLASLILAKSINWTPSYDLPDENEGKFVSPINRLYLNKISDLCKRNSVNLLFEASPIRESRKLELGQIWEDEDALIQKYTQTITFQNDSLFRDEVHFLNESIPSDPLNLK